MSQCGFRKWNPLVLEAEEVQYGKKIPIEKYKKCIGTVSERGNEIELNPGFLMCHARTRPIEP